MGKSKHKKSSSSSSTSSDSHTVMSALCANRAVCADSAMFAQTANIANFANSIPPIQNVYYVGLNGNDTTGNGSIAAPYATVTAAYMAAAAVWTAAPANRKPYQALLIAPGTYTSPQLQVTITRLSIVAMDPSPLSTNLAFGVQYSPTSVDSSNNQSMLFGISIVPPPASFFTQALLVYSPTVADTLSVVQCYIDTGSTISDTVLVDSGTVGSISFDRCQLSNSSSDGKSSILAALKVNSGVVSSLSHCTLSANDVDFAGSAILVQGPDGTLSIIELIDSCQVQSLRVTNGNTFAAISVNGGNGGVKNIQTIRNSTISGPRAVAVSNASIINIVDCQLASTVDSVITIGNTSGISVIQGCTLSQTITQATPPAAIEVVTAPARGSYVIRNNLFQVAAVIVPYTTQTLSGINLPCAGVPLQFVIMNNTFDFTGLAPDQALAGVNFTGDGQCTVVTKLDKGGDGYPTNGVLNSLNASIGTLTTVLGF